MSNFIVNGGNKLKGEIKSNAAKNSTVAILVATAMLEGKTTLVNVPVIEEVKRIIEILSSIGLKIEWTGGHELSIDNPGELDLAGLNKESYAKTRSGLLLSGALLSRFDEFELPKSSGCRLGKRTVSPFAIALEHLGVSLDCVNGEYRIKKNQPQAAEFTMYETGDTATENTIMAALAVPGRSTVHFASANYMVQDLCHFLARAGAKIEGIGTGKLQIEGGRKLKAVKGYPVMPDPIESMAWIAVAATTGSELAITHCPIDFLRLELEKLRQMGLRYETGRSYKSENGQFDLVDIMVYPSELIALPDKLHSNPYPGLNIDNLPLFLPILTRAKGRTLVHDWVYENRAIYYIELNKLGAEILLLDPHRVMVSGPSELRPGEIICPPALRPSLNLLITMLAAPGRSILRNSYSIDRGYENIVPRLNSLGADIQAIDKLDF